MDKSDRFKIYTQLVGMSSWEIGSTSFKRPVIVNDGPLGLRKPTCNDFANQAGVLTSVCLLSPSALASSFDKDVCYENGYLLAIDCLSKDVDVILAPGINIKRSCLCGRNFEYFSEDPYLTGVLASKYILGIEENGASSCVKHFACNNQENYRLTNSSEVSLRALNEIYLSAFRYVFKHANPKMLMTSYNKINGIYVNEDEYLLQTKVRKEYDYKGLIISDWTAVVDKGMTIKAGLNVEMPPSKRTFEHIDEGYLKTFNDEDLLKRKEELDYALKTILDKKRTEVDYDFDAIHLKAKELAKDSFVLLKNNNYFPFNKNEKVLILGDFANKSHFLGGGSAWVNAYKKTTFIDALDNENVNYEYLQAYESDKYLLDENYLLKNINKFDKVLVFIGQYEHDESEGRDRSDISLRKEQDKLITFLNDNDISYASIVITGSVIDIKKIKENSKAILLSYLAGEGMYEALYETVFGLSNPSGRLPETWISNLDVNPIYNQIKKNNPFYSYYDDDIFVGYRYYDALKDDKDVNYHFGYGLSYSNFSYSNFDIELIDDEINVSLNVENISKLDGKDVIQVYTSKINSNVYRPIKELKGFEKVFVKANSLKSIQLKLSLDELKVYDYDSDTMLLEDGEYEIIIAKNLKEILFKKIINIKGVTLKKHLDIIPLTRKENPTKVDLTFPVELVLNDQRFIDMFNEKHSHIDMNDFFNKRKGMLNEPIKNLTYTNELDIDFDIIYKYFK